MGRALITVGLGFGDEGKGSVVDYLTRQFGASAVVRYCGGPQAGHSVVLPDGRHHTFSQFGAGTFVPGVRTILSRHMLVNPLNAFREAEHLGAVGVDGALRRLTVDAYSLVITPMHAEASIVADARRRIPHGTCGMGVGEAVADAMEEPASVLRVRDLNSPAVMRRKLAWLIEKKMDEGKWHDDPPKAVEIDNWIAGYTQFSALVDVKEHADELVQEMLGNNYTVVFEGAQGVLLDERYGFHPHTTWSNVTVENAYQLIGRHTDAETTVYGVTRAYSTRHGAGPFPAHEPDVFWPDEPHNDAAGAQGEFRRGYFDPLLTRYAVEAAGDVDALAVTCLDQLPPERRLMVDYYEYTGDYPDLDGYFVYGRDGRIHGLEYPDGTLAHTESLGRRLFDCVPYYADHTGSDARTFAEIIGSEVGVPVGIMSYGPTHESKALAVMK